MIGAWSTLTNTTVHVGLVSPVEITRARAGWAVAPVGLTDTAVPVPTSVPPQLPVYQSMVCPAGTAPDSTVEFPMHTVEGVACTPVGLPIGGGPWSVKSTLEVSKNTFPTASTLILACVLEMFGSVTWAEPVLGVLARSTVGNVTPRSVESET